MRPGFYVIALLCSLPVTGQAARPSYGIDDAVALAKRQNLEIGIAQKQIQAARGGFVEARSGYLPSLVSSGLYDKREHQEDTRLRDEDYNVSLRLQHNVYTGGAVSNQLAIARINIEKQDYLFQEVVSRVAMDVRVAFHELLLNRAKIRVHEDSVRVLEEELKTQQERLKAGTVGTLNVERAQVALANERPELINAQTDLKNSYLRLAELMGMNVAASGPSFEAVGQLEYRARHVDLNECLVRADANRPEIKARQKDIDIEEKQYAVDQSGTLMLVASLTTAIW